MYNKIKFESLQEIKDKDSKYILVREKLERMATLFNTYAPPKSEKSFYKNVFDIITQETEGIFICGGDWNVVLNHTLGSSSTKKNS